MHSMSSLNITKSMSNLYAVMFEEPVLFHPDSSITCLWSPSAHYLGLRIVKYVQMSQLSSGKLAHNTSSFDSYPLTCQTGIHSLLIFPVFQCVPLLGCNSVILINAGEDDAKKDSFKRKGHLGIPHNLQSHDAQRNL